MRHAFVLFALCGVVVAGLGCQHVGGKCDCTYDPSDAVLPTPNNPYYPTGAAITGQVPAAAEPKTPAPLPKEEPKSLPPGKGSDTGALPVVPLLPPVGN